MEIELHIKLDASMQHNIMLDVSQCNNNNNWCVVEKETFKCKVYSNLSRVVVREQSLVFKMIAVRYNNHCAVQYFIIIIMNNTEANTSALLLNRFNNFSC